MHILPNGIAVIGQEDILSREVMERGLASDHMLRDLLPLIKPGDWVIDGGASLGDHTGAYCDAVGPTGKVYAFEANPEFYECLVHNVPRAISINGCLHENRGLEFWVHVPTENVGAGNITTDPALESPTDKVVGPVPSVRIDDYELERLDYMKLDVEGCEYFALLGAISTIKRCRPKIVLEMTRGCIEKRGITAMHVYRLLDSLNYSYRSIRNDPSRYCDMCDILCTPR